MSSVGSAPSDEQIALLKASSRGDGQKVLELLEDSTWSSHIPNGALRISLQKFAMFGNASLVRFLLEKGAEANPISDKEVPVLHKAAEMGHVEVVRLLISKGADIEVKEKFGRTALFAAAYK